MIITKHLASADLEGVWLERSTDVALIPKDAPPELISIKHREESQQKPSSWAFGNLVKDVLVDLHQAWVASGRDSHVTVVTNAGFHDKAHFIEEICKKDRARDGTIRREAVVLIKKALDIDAPEARAFLQALTLDGGWPNRHHIGHVGTARVKKLLERHRPGPIIAAEECYEELCRLIEQRSSEVSAEEIDNSTPPLATIAAAVRQREQLREARQYLSAEFLRKFLLSTYDNLTATQLAKQGVYTWQADSNFTGRQAELAAIEEHLSLGAVHPVAPLVIHGPPGCGKTALAIQYAATRSGAFHPVLINGETRTSIATALRGLRGPAQPQADGMDLAALRSPVAIGLPASSAVLLIIDGVTDPQAVAGLIPSESLCRVIITSTSHYLGPGFSKIALGGWGRAESCQFMQQQLDDVQEAEAETLAAAMHDHPLSIAQAVGFCSAGQRTISEFLELFHAYPSRMLDLPNAPGHAKSIATTTHMLLDEAARRDPLARHLADAIALLASEPISEATLNSRAIYAWLRTPKPAEKSKGLHRLREFLLRARDEESAPAADGFPPQAKPIIDALSDTLNRSAAVTTLLEHALLKRLPTGLEMHPIVALIIRESINDREAALAVAFSWFGEATGDLDNLGFESKREHITHLHALTSAALQLGLDGPAVLGGCYLVATFMPQMPQDPQQDNGESRFISISQIAAAGERIANTSLPASRSGLSTRIAMSAAAAGGHYREGRADQAFEKFGEMLALGCEWNDPVAISTALINMSSIAVEFNRDDLKTQASERLEKLSETTSRSKLIHLAAAYAHMRIMRNQGQIQEAMMLHTEVLELLTESRDIDGFLKHLLYSEGARLARDLQENVRAYEFEQAALKALTDERGLQPDRRSILSLCDVADAAASVPDLDQALNHIKKAESLAISGFEHDPEVRERLLSVKGHVLVNRGEHEKALPILQESVALKKSRGFDRLEDALAADLYNLSNAQLWIGQYDEALRSADEALEVDSKWFNKEHPQVSRDLTNIAYITAIAAARGDIKRAIQICEKTALEINKEGIVTGDAAGGMWVGGVILGKTIEPLSTTLATEWAARLLQQLGRPIIHTLHDDIGKCFTITDPLRLAMLRRRSGQWEILEVLVMGAKIGSLPDMTTLSLFQAPRSQVPRASRSW